MLSMIASCGRTSGNQHIMYLGGFADYIEYSWGLLNHSQLLQNAVEGNCWSGT